MTKLSKKKEFALASVQTVDDVEYIEASYKNDGDKQYINTNNYVDWNKEFSFKIVTVKTNSARSILVGSFSTANSFNIEWTASKQPRFYIGMSREDYALPAVPSGLLVIIEVSWQPSAQQLIISAKSLDGKAYNESYTYTMTNTRTGLVANPIWIFADKYRVDGTPSNDFNGTQKIYQIEWYESGLLKAKYIPKCKNGTAFFYDLVSGNSYYNGSNTQFKTGQKIREVEYLELDDAQRFNSLFYPNTLSTTVKTKFTFGGTAMMMGCRNSMAYNTMCSFYLPTATSGRPYSRCRLDWMTGEGATLTSDFTSEVVELEITGNYAKVNGVEYTDTTKTSVDMEFPFYIGCCYTTNASDPYSYPQVGKIYFVRLLNTTTREDYRYFIPAIDEVGNAFLFDKVSHTIFNSVNGEITKYGRRIMPVEYLYGSTPSSIATGISFADHKWETDIKSEANYVSLLGSTTGAANYFGLMSSSDNIGVYTLHTSNSEFDIKLNNKTRRTVNLDCKKNSSTSGVLTMAVDGQSVSRSNSSSYETERDYRLFSINPSYLGNNYIYGNRCYNRATSELLQNLIPARDENAIGFMFDTLTHTCFDVTDGKTKIGKLLLNSYNNDEIPYGYTKVDYLKSDSAQYFDTGISGGSDDLEFDITFNYDTFVSFGEIFGNWLDDSHNTTRLQLWDNSLGADVSNLNTASTNQGNEYGNSLTVNLVHHVISNIDAIIVDGVSTTRTKTAKATDNTNNICLFNRSLTNPNTTRNIGLAIYAFKVRKAGKIIGNFIPVLRNIDAKPGMFDTISRKFFINEGTGEFKYGIASEYASVNYLESTGPQWIDTGIKLKSSYGVEIEAKQTATTTGVGRYLFGDSPASTGRYTIVVTSGGGQYRFNLDALFKNSGVSGYDEKWHTHKIENKTYYIDGESKGSLAAPDFTRARNARLFNVATTSTLIDNYWQIKRCRIADECDTTLANLVPVIRISDSKPGMYDLISKSFLINGASGEDFIYG